MIKDWAKTTSDGKPGISVRQHCHAVKYVARELLRRFPLFFKHTEIDINALLFLAASHDVGKISWDFLQKCQTWLVNEHLRDRARNEGWSTIYTHWHPELSQQSLRLFLENHGHDYETAYFWAVVVGAHHGRFKASGAPRPVQKNNDLHALEEERQQCLSEFWQECGEPTLPKVHNADSRLWSVAGLITLADWIGSDEDFFPADRALSDETLQKIACEAVTEIGLGKPIVRKDLSFEDIFNGMTAYPMQIACQEAITGPGVYVLEAPMGMGKTEAALLAAYSLLQRDLANGIYFALPTQATSNRMFERMESFVSKICPDAVPAQLIHGNSWLRDDLKSLMVPGFADVDQDEQKLASNVLWFNSSRRALFAPFGVGTIDQVLLAVLAVKHFSLRRFALSGKIVILDEVHTYDVYTGRLIKGLCRELEQLGCTVIILSATLTAAGRRNLLENDDDCEDENAPYPMLTGRVQSGFIKPRTPPPLPDKEIEIRHAEQSEAEQMASMFAQQGAHVLWVCDTVQSAQETFFRLRQSCHDSFDLGLLHSRFPYFMRQQIEENWMIRFGKKVRIRGRGAILVATQIVEQSVDLDADVLFSELAPTDMLLQRLGRLWRHIRNSRPVKNPIFYIIEEKTSLDDLRHMEAQSIKKSLGSKSFIYKPYVLLRTLEQWSRRSQIILPKEIRSIISETYNDKELPESWNELSAEQWAEDLASKRLADMNTNIWSSTVDDDVNISTRISNHKEMTFVLTCEDAGKSIKLLDGSEINLDQKNTQLNCAKCLHKNIVKMPEHYFTKYEEDKRLKKYYIDGCILIREGETSILGLKKGYMVIWDKELGLLVQKESA
ncbi:MAG: CRISPR-associated helicase Cas3' [Desulfovibrio sp.]|nr:CRISPR-associated helicase Cas3' [Desulfovibrio sp.]